MAKAKAAHHRGTHQVRARRVVAYAYAHPETRCARCGKTLAEHGPTKTGKPPTWSAGHVVDGQAGGEYRPEVLSCNSSAGAKAGNAKRRTKHTSVAW